MRFINKLILFIAVLLAVSHAVAAAAAAPAARPNILLIVADDLGFSDLGSYGSEIDTPNLDRLAQRGLKFSHFYTAAACSPTRAMLMTGVDHHQTGFGALAETRQGHQMHAPGYEGYLRADVATLPERLRARGYRTMMAGKWHLGLIPESGPKARGFDRSYALSHGVSGHYSDKGYMPQTPKVDYFDEGELVRPPADFYSSDYFTTKLLEYLAESRAAGQPFFAYLPYTAPHYPLQAPQELIKKYLPRYERGWDEIRAMRIAKLRRLGLLGAKTPAAPRPDGIPAWDTLSDQQRQFETKRMAVYAAMIERMDDNVGRLLAALDSAGVANDTLIVVMSDNGAEATELETLPPLAPWYDKNFDMSYEALGGPQSYVSQGPGWASVSSTPVSWYKGLVAEGGVRAPLIIAGPTVRRGLRGDTVTVMDLAVTVLDAAGVAALDEALQSRGVREPQGKSFLPLLRQAHVPHVGEPVFMESAGSVAAIEDGRWKALRVGAPWGDGVWRLFDLRSDPAELVDLGASQPARLERLRAGYQAYAQRVGVQDPNGPPVPWGFSAKFPATAVSKSVLENMRRGGAALPAGGPPGAAELPEADEPVISEAQLPPKPESR
ncbi:MAG: arylsulfatase [Steroidobacteraceae bacterium]